MPRPVGFEIHARMTWFFDRPRVLRALAAAERESLSRAGNMVKAIAQRSMRYVTPLAEQRREVERGERKRLGRVAGPSDPGTPPHAVRPHPYLRQHLYAAYDPVRRTAVAGPTPLGRGVVPRLHEFGGRVKVRNPRRRLRKVGGAGEIRLVAAGYADSPTGAQVVTAHRAVYAKLRTAAQAARANRLNEQLYGPSEHQAVYPERPYMGPALEKAAPYLAETFRGSVREAG